MTLKYSVASLCLTFDNNCDTFQIIKNNQDFFFFLKVSLCVDFFDHRTLGDPPCRGSRTPWCARLWKSCCALGPRSRCDASPPVQQERRNGSAGAAATMTQQFEASVCLHTTGTHCVCVCVGLFVHCCKCAYALVWAHTSHSYYCHPTQ